MQKKKFLAIILGVLAVLGAYVFFNPANSYFAPKCMFKTLTGYDCPSCGGQRVLHALLNGRVKDAFLLNPFLFLATPYLILVAYTSFSKDRLASGIKPAVQHTATIGVYILLYVAWWIVRNTHFWQSMC